MRALRTHWIVLTVTCVGAFLRFTNLNWDLGGRLHPDEALIVNGALTVKFFSQLSPGFHDYNGLTVYLLKAASLAAAFVFRNPYWSVTPEGVTLVGRFVSALFSTLSIPLVYVFGKQVWKKEIGIIAAILFSFTPIVIQLSHFYTTESILIFLLLTLLYAASLYANHPDTHSLVRLAVPMGLLLATKNTAYLFLPIPIITLAHHGKRTSYTIRAFVRFIALVFAVFLAASPYSFIDFAGYIQRSRYLADVVSGRLLMDWTIQFQDTGGEFWIKTLLFAFGPLAIFGPIGIVGVLVNTGTRKKLPYTAAWWSIGFLIFLACTYLKFTRYAAPLLPLFAIYGAKILWGIRKTTIGKVLCTVAVTSQIIYGCMFLPVYTTPHTSLQATDWIKENIPQKSTILIEEWNSIVRFSRPELASGGYRRISFNFYALPDEGAKTQRLREALAQSDYVLIESPKIKNTVTRLRSRYPHSKKFYEDLENGKLGFTKVATFTSYPRLGPFVINDDLAEETFTVFDHPAIKLYKKTR